VPYEQIKTDLAAARATFRQLTNRFVEEFVSRCDALAHDEQQSLVMELFAQDLQAGLDGAVSARRQSLVRSVEKLWDKYAVPLTVIQGERAQLQMTLADMLEGLG